jgi:hypothetical protein
MAEYVALEKEIYDSVRGRPFTSIHTKPTWAQKELLNEEAEQIALDINVSYPWSDDYGLLAEIQGEDKYQNNTGFEYVSPTRPPDLDPRILLPNQNQTQIKILQSESVILKRDYAVVQGFRRGIGENIRDCLETRYYEQLYENVFKYKRILPRAYLAHLEAKWVILDELQIEDMVKKYKRGWSQDEHFTTFAHRLDREQKKLSDDNIVVSDADKKQHLMVELWGRDLFDRPVMIEWNERPREEREYAHAVAYFTKHLAAIETYEAAGGGASKKQGFESTNAVAEIQAACENKITENKAETSREMTAMATEFVGVINEQKEQIKSLREVLASIENKLSTRVPATPPRRSRRVLYESDSDTEEETPPRRKRKEDKTRSQKQKKAAKKAAEAKIKKPEDKWKKSDGYNPGDEWSSVPWNLRPVWKKLRVEYWRTGTAAAKADKKVEMKRLADQLDE